MHLIRLDAAGWRTKDDFYADLLSALKAPPWHGRNLDALWDSLTSSSINEIEPPFRIEIRNIEMPPDSVQVLISAVDRLFAEANAEFSIGVSMTYSPSTNEHGEPRR